MTRTSHIMGWLTLALYAALLTACGNTSMVYHSASEPGIVTIQDDGSAKRVVTAAGDSPSFSPGGARVVFADDMKLVIADASSGSTTTLADGCPPDLRAPGRNCLYHHPRWSPDGSRIAYTMDLYGGSTESFAYKVLHAMDARGGNRTRFLAEQLASNPAWSPNSRSIVYVTEGGDLARVDVGGGNRARLTSDGKSSDPVWANLQGVGERILFVSTRDGRRQVYMMNPDGSNVTRVTNHAHEDWSPAVRNGSPVIAVVSNRPGKGSSGGNHANVFLIRPDGQEIRQLTEDGGSKSRLEWANP